MCSITLFYKRCQQNAMSSLEMLLLACVIYFGFDSTLAVEYEPVCSKCSCEYQFIKKLIRMEIQLENERLTNELMKSEIEDISERLRNMEEKEDSNKTPVVAFSAYNPASKTPGDGQIVIFQQVLLNEGGGYDPSSGVFVAPVGGLYQFTTHFCNSASKFVAYAIVHNETEIARSTKGSTPSEGCSSVSDLLKLKVGDHVTVRGTWSQNQMTEDRYRRASYTGVLINS